MDRRVELPAMLISEARIAFTGKIKGGATEIDITVYRPLRFAPCMASKGHGFVRIGDIIVEHLNERSLAVTNCVIFVKF